MASVRGWRRVRWVVLSLLVVLALFAGDDFVHHLRNAEDWIASLGWVGPMIFIGLTVVLTSVFVPDSVFGVVAGALFGLIGGTLVMVAAGFCTAALDFALSRLFLRHLVCNALSRRPRLAAIHRAVGEEGLKFQFLLRLTPLNPVVINYVLGAAETRLPTYLTACIGLIPALAVEVYFGHAAKHAALMAGGAGESSVQHTVWTLVGLVLCVLALLYTARVARRALRRYEEPPSAAATVVAEGAMTGR